MSSCDAPKSSESTSPPKKVDAARNKNPINPTYPISIKKASLVKSFSKAKSTKTSPSNQQKRTKKHRRRRWKKSKSKHLPVSHNTHSALAFNNSNNCVWFWKNYELAQQWQRAHTLNVLSANSVVRLFQKSLFKPLSKPSKRNFARTKLHKKHNNKNLSRGRLNLMAGHLLAGSFSSLNSDLTCQTSGEEIDHYENEENYQFEFKVDENMKNFLEQSMKHKQEMQRLREAEHEESLDALMFEAPKESALDERKKTMEFLYGSAAPKILSMEMALQMSFDRHFDQKQPPLWPNLPLKL